MAVATASTTPWTGAMRLDREGLTRPAPAGAVVDALVASVTAVVGPFGASVVGRDRRARRRPQDQADGVR